MADITDIFASPDEQLTAVLGTHAAQSFFTTGVLGNGFIVLSDRRVYFRGRCLQRVGKRFSYIREDRTVDVENVTGTGFVHFDPIWRKVLGIIFSVLTVATLILGAFWDEFLFAAPATLVIAVVFFVRYAMTKKTVFEVAFAGGGFGLDMRWMSPEESANFQKAIKMVGDEVKRQERMYGHGTSAATELTRLAELVEKGLITRQEFEAQKARLLSTY